MFDGFSVWHLLILFLIVVLVFGSKRLVSLGPDLGRAMRGFKQAMHGEMPEQERAQPKDEDKGLEGESRASVEHKPDSVG